MNSIGENCNELKKQYDNCFLTWFSERFLKGDTNDQMCAPYFKVYQQCVKVCTYYSNFKFVDCIGMEACRELKNHYDSCFNTWFTEKFLKRDNNDAMCAPLLKIYKECVEKAMKEHHIDLKEVERDMLGSPDEQSPPPPKNS